ncbi:hypothetical protein GQ457_01G052940 [Hibiscus cannabinus]
MMNGNKEKTPNKGELAEGRKKEKKKEEAEGRKKEKKNEEAEGRKKEKKNEEAEGRKKEKKNEVESRTETRGMDPMAKMVINQTTVNPDVVAEKPHDILAFSRSLHNIDSSLE